MPDPAMMLVPQPGPPIAAAGAAPPGIAAAGAGGARPGAAAPGLFQAFLAIETLGGAAPAGTGHGAVAKGATAQAGLSGPAGSGEVPGLSVAVTPTEQAASPVQAGTVAMLPPAGALMAGPQMPGAPPGAGPDQPAGADRGPQTAFPPRAEAHAPPRRTPRPAVRGGDDVTARDQPVSQVSATPGAEGAMPPIVPGLVPGLVPVAAPVPVVATASGAGHGLAAAAQPSAAVPAGSEGGAVAAMPAAAPEPGDATPPRTPGAPMGEAMARSGSAATRDDEPGESGHGHDGAAPASTGPAESFAGLLTAPPVAACMSAAPVAVASAHPPAPAHVAVQVAPVLIQLAAPGAPGQITVQLAPQELGRMTIGITRPPEGPAQVVFSVERPETLALLRSDQGALGQALDRAGISADQRVVTLELAPPQMVALASAADQASQNPAHRPPPQTALPDRAAAMAGSADAGGLFQGAAGQGMAGGQRRGDPGPGGRAGGSYGVDPGGEAGFGGPVAGIWRGWSRAGLNITA